MIFEYFICSVAAFLSSFFVLQSYSDSVKLSLSLVVLFAPSPSLRHSKFGWYSVHAECGGVVRLSGHVLNPTSAFLMLNYYVDFAPTTTWSKQSCKGLSIYYKL